VSTDPAARSPELADLWALVDDPAAPVSFATLVRVRRRRLDQGLVAESREIETALTARFQQEHGTIVKSYINRHAIGGCALTETDRPDRPPRALHTVLNSTSDRLLSMETRCGVLFQDAVAVFADDRHRAERVVATDAVYGAMTRVLAAAETLAPGRRASEAERRAARVAARNQVQLVTERVSLLIQRQARFSYLLGILAGAALALALAVGLSLVTARFWSARLDTPALAAAAVFGTLGAVVSVFQRISTGQLVLDYSAPVGQKYVLGCLRPFIGLVSGLVVHFLLLAGLATGQAGSTSVAFAATVGFVAGFSERLLVDMVERAGRLLTGKAEDAPDPAAPATGGSTINADIAADVDPAEVAVDPPGPAPPAAPGPPPVNGTPVPAADPA
jgi:hypothetical protein